MKSATIGKPITFTLSATNRHAFNMSVGEIVRFAKKKRICSVIKNIDNSIPYQHTLTLKAGYMAAPKSKLRTQTIFSKVKTPILNKLHY